MKILNLTQHKTTPDQINAGVVDLEGAERLAVLELLTFNDLPTIKEIEYRANDIAEIASSVQSADSRDFAQDAGFIHTAMIGGAPFFMSALEKALIEWHIDVVYSFSLRESVEKTELDGSVHKTNVFRHIGFIKVRS